MQWVMRPCPTGESASHMNLWGRQGLGLTVGNMQAHISHNLAFTNGVVWCQACGFYVTASLQKRGNMGKLRQICMRTPTLRGRGFLSRLMQDKPPRPDMDWPE